MLTLEDYEKEGIFVSGKHAWVQVKCEGETKKVCGKNRNTNQKRG